MRITKVYTKTGDKGKTRLAGGQPVWKDALRVEAYGTVDELSAVIGVVRTQLLKEQKDAGLAPVEYELRWIQNKLFDLGGLLATKPGQSFPHMPSIEETDVVRLERSIDSWQKDLLPLKEFILPGGGVIASTLHLARTVCRRAERRCVGLMRKEQVDPVSIIFLNRLSDALFVLARWVAKTQGEPEFLWQREASDKTG
jgi:cob(I)alamin adenosyltransferase